MTFGSLENYLKLFKTPSGEEVRRIRVSTLASYFYCSPKAWLNSLGVESPRSPILSEGSRIHAEIETARKLSKYEQEFKDTLGQFFAGDVISRPWLDQKTEICMGELVTHGYDDFKVTPDREVDLLEYKTKGGWRIRPVDLMPAIFQCKVYAWLLEPYLMMHGYHWREIWIIFLRRTRQKTFVPIGEHLVEDYNSVEVEKKIARIFDEWNRASEAKTNEERRNILIGPKKYKCVYCPDVFKKGKNSLGLRCPFQ